MKPHAVFGKEQDINSTGHPSRSAADAVLHGLCGADPGVETRIPFLALLLTSCVSTTQQLGLPSSRSSFAP